jgi:hypothetical protein
MMPIRGAKYGRRTAVPTHFGEGAEPVDLKAGEKHHVEAFGKSGDRNTLGNGKRGHTRRQARSNRLLSTDL